MDDRDSSGWTDSPVTKDRLSFGGHDASSLLTGFVFGAALGALILHLFKKRAFSEEPPIRVKGGSMEFRLLTDTMYWKPLGGMKWKVSDGTRAKEYYQATIIVKSSGKCVSQTKPGNVRVTYSDGTWVELKATGKQTRLKSSAPLELSDNDRVLTYVSKDGYVSRIEVDDLDCQLEPGALDHMLLLDY